MGILGGDTMDNTKVTLIQRGDLEPSCPECLNANAMLEHSRPLCKNVLICRDCGYSVELARVVIKWKPIELC